MIILEKRFSSFFNNSKIDLLFNSAELRLSINNILHSLEY